MSSSELRVRRATIEDRPALCELWESMQLPAEDLEKRLTEFQVAVDADGRIQAAIGLQIVGKQGRIHSETFADFAQSDPLREHLWERLQGVANNHGLVRLWTTEEAPFWSHNDLAPATPEDLGRLPEAWIQADRQWLTLKLREDIEEVVSLDKEFAVFMESERQESQRMMEQAKMFKLIAVILAVGLFLLVIGFGVYVLQRNPGLLNR